MTAPWYDPDNEGLDVIGAWQGVWASSLANSLIDRSGNGNDLTIGPVPEWSRKNGWDFDGTSYLIMPVVPKPDQRQTIMVQFSDCEQGYYIAGIFEKINFSNQYLLLGPDFEGESDFFHGNNGLFAPVGGSAGNIAIAGDSGYKDGVLAVEGLVPFTETPTFNCYLGGANMTTGTHYAVTKIQAAVAYNQILTGAEIGKVAERMQIWPGHRRAWVGLAGRAPGICIARRGD